MNCCKWVISTKIMTVTRSTVESVLSHRRLQHMNFIIPSPKIFQSLSLKFARYGCIIDPQLDRRTPGGIDMLFTRGDEEMSMSFICHSSRYEHDRLVAYPGGR